MIARASHDHRVLVASCPSLLRPVAVIPPSKYRYPKPNCSRILRPFAASAVASRAAAHESTLLDRAALAVEPETAPGQLAHLARALGEIRRLLSSEIGGADVWLRRLDTAIRDSAQPRKYRIGVFGDEMSAPHDVVSAILQDPLVDSEASRQALLRRHRDVRHNVLEIGCHLQTVDDSLRLQSSWLQSSGCDLLEVKASVDALDHLLQTDAVLIVLDPFRLASPLHDILPPLLSRGTVHFVINGPIPPDRCVADIEAMLRKQLSKLGYSSPILVSFIRSDLALEALDALSVGLDGATSDRTAAFDVFQKKFLRSGVAPVQALLPKITTDFQARTAAGTGSLALAVIDDVIHQDRAAIRTVSQAIKDLDRTASAAATRARHLSVSSRGIEGGMVEGGVQHADMTAQMGLKERLSGRLSWLRLIGGAKVDDVASELDQYIGTEFGADLERQLIFESGQLSQLQSELFKETDSTMNRLATKTTWTDPATHPFSSPLLFNHISSLSLSIPPFEPVTLIEPIQLRRHQLIQQTVPRLHLSAQRAMLSTYSLATIGVLSSWAACVPPVSLLSGATATALALLSVAGSIALGQRLWGRAQRKFLKDFARISSMLREDLQTRFASTVEVSLLSKPGAAADGLERLRKRREVRLDDLQTRVDNLRRRLLPAL